MKMFGFAGYSGSGKTTLIEKLIPRFVTDGLLVSLIKHAHHGFDIDRPGKDSYRHREAGCTEVLLTSDQRWVLMHELRGRAEPALADQLTILSPCDLVLVEGYKATPIPKLEVYRPANGQPPLYPGNPNIVAVASDETDRRAAAAARPERPRRDRGFHYAASWIQAMNPGLLSFDEALAQLLAGARPPAETEVVDTLRCRRPGAGAGSGVGPRRCRRWTIRRWTATPCAAPTCRRPERRLRLAQRIPAGSVGAPLAAGTAARIFTGAPMPPGADAVVMQELCEHAWWRGDDQSCAACRRVDSARRRGHPRRRRDAGGRLALSARSRRHWPPRSDLRGCRCSGASGWRCSSPATNWSCRASRCRRARIYNSNRYLLRALLEGLGCEVTDFGIVPDKLDATRARAARGRGRARPDHHQRRRVGRRGGSRQAGGARPRARSTLWKIAIKPGKPLAFGQRRAEGSGGVRSSACRAIRCRASSPSCMLVRPFILRLQGVRRGAAASARAARRFRLAEAGSAPRVPARAPQRGRRSRALPQPEFGVLTSTVWGDGLVDNPPGQADPHAAIRCAFCPFPSCYTDSMSVRILYFAGLREAAGAERGGNGTAAATLPRWRICAMHLAAARRGVGRAGAGQEPAVAVNQAWPSLDTSDPRWRRDRLLPAGDGRLSMTVRVQPEDFDRRRGDGSDDAG